MLRRIRPLSFPRPQMNPFKLCGDFVKCLRTMTRGIPTVLLSAALMFGLMFGMMFATSRPASAQTEARPFVHNGYSRPYLVHRPEHVAPHPAVVFMLGGITSTAKSTSEEFNWIAGVRPQRIPRRLPRAGRHPD